jgi:hypothetical protein
VNADTVKTGRVGSSVSGRAGFQFASSSNILPIASDGTLTNGVASLGRNTDGNFKDAYFSGTVNADGGFRGPTWKRVDINHGLAINGSGAIYPSGTLGETNLGTTGTRFKDAYFSGTIYGKVDDVADHVKAITPTQIANWDAGTSGGGGPSANIDSRIKDDDIVHWNKAWGWGDHSAANYEISGTAYTKAQSDSLYMSKNAIANGSRTGDMLSWTNGGWAVDPYISTGSKTVDIGTTEIINLYSPTISHEPFQVNGTMTATTVVKYGGTADQLLCANGSVADKGYSKAETKANVVMTEQQYNALGSKDANTIYFLT